MVDIVRRMGWSYISIIYEESNYGIKVSLCVMYAMLTFDTSSIQITNVIASFLRLFEKKNVEKWKKIWKLKYRKKAERERERKKQENTTQNTIVHILWQMKHTTTTMN